MSAGGKPQRTPQGGVEATDPAVQVLTLLRTRGQTLAIGESLTGGLVAAAITALPGASQAFRGSVTAYATGVKRDVLGVDGALLDSQGAVTPEVARQLATGARALLSADWGVGTTGVAGPEPQDGKPVGTAYVAVAAPGRDAVAQRLSLTGDRSAIQTSTVRAVLILLRNQLIDSPGDGAEYGTERR